MRKYLIFLGAACWVMSGLAQVTQPDNVAYIPYLYGLRLSPNGNWMGSFAGYATIYDTRNGEILEYKDATLGLGNCIADNGMAVGDNALMKDGKTIYSETLQKFRYCDINGINPLATRITGTVSNPENDGLSYVPFVADLDEQGNVVDTTILPYPLFDFFDARPQFVSAVWISDDGKTVAGQVIDNYGLFIYPIMYVEDESGDWTYTLPSKELFNPDNVPIIQNPYNNQPTLPVVTDYMDPVQAAAYDTAYKQWVAGRGSQPDPKDYMDPDKYDQYEYALAQYMDWNENANKIFQEYIDNYYKILATTPTFSQNELTLHPSGAYMMSHGGKVDEYGALIGKIYQFSPEGVERVIDLDNESLYPAQILSDGTLIASLPKMEVPSSYILLPGSDQFITVQEFLSADKPVVSWIDYNFPGGTGVVSLSDDKSVLAGALIAGQLSDELLDEVNYTYSTYVVKINESNGVEELIATPGDGIYRVFNLQGVKILETKDASAINMLPGGIYVVNGKKVFITN